MKAFVALNSVLCGMGKRKNTDQEIEKDIYVTKDTLIPEYGNQYELQPNERAIGALIIVIGFSLRTYLLAYPLISNRRLYICTEFPMNKSSRAMSG